MASGLLHRVARGDADAMRECVDRYGGLVWSLARRMVGSDADDVVQDIFLEIWRSAGRYDPDKAQETTFVAMIARRRLIDRRRQRIREPQPAPWPEPPSAGDPLESVEVSSEARAALRAMEGLSAEQQRVLGLAVLRGLTHEQVAQATGLPLGTVKTHVRRGLIRIRQILGEGRRRQEAAS